MKVVILVRKSNHLKVSIIGGGASGFFSAIRCKELYADAQVTIYEKSKKVLSKVKISGGGRCNVTNSETNIKEFAKNYPRGENQLKKLFGKFGAKETIQWFEDRGVALVVQEDGCIFPKSQDSQSIIDCLLNECSKLGVSIKTEHHFTDIEVLENGYELEFKNKTKVVTDKIIFSLGGLPNPNQYAIFRKLGYQISEPVPSLYTFNMPNHPVTKLMGLVVEPATVKVQGTKLIDNGPLLITHWGMSGPAVLKTSAWGARILNEKNYEFLISINWLNDKKANEVLEILNHLQDEAGSKSMKNFRLKEIPIRLWEYLLEKIGADSKMTWTELNKKTKNKLVEVLINDVYEVKGKTTFKEEFVTCGGVALENINMKTLESKLHSGVYFTGEFLDLDGITGGFNFQSAWTTGYIAGSFF